MGREKIGERNKGNIIDFGREELEMAFTPRFNRNGKILGEKNWRWPSLPDLIGMEREKSYGKLDLLQEIEKLC